MNVRINSLEIVLKSESGGFSGVIDSHGRSTINSRQCFAGRWKRERSTSGSGNDSANNRYGVEIALTVHDFVLL